MKRASYRQGIAWIAVNESDGSEDRLQPEVVAYLVPSLLLADLFGVEPERVGEDIVRYRKRASRTSTSRAGKVRRGHMKEIAETLLAARHRIQERREAEELARSADARIPEDAAAELKRRGL